MLSFSSDGLTLASESGSRGYLVRLWNTVTGEDIRTLEGHTGSVASVSFSPDGLTLASGSLDDTILLWDLNPSPHTPAIRGDINGDGAVNIQDLVLVAGQLGQTGQNDADVNGDGAVNIQDLVLVAGALGNTAAAPALPPHTLTMLNAADVQAWLNQAQQLKLTDPSYLRGIAVLEHLLAALTPKATLLLPNYPNPFNPETWIPYHLAEPADVTLTIYDTQGTVVRQFDLGYQRAGYYKDKTRAVYWDGRNATGQAVASGVYFYHLDAGDYSQTRRMVILK